MQSQREVVEFLSQPAAYGLSAEAAGGVERYSTHGAHVFLAGERAYKLKRAVRLVYLDYSTPERRKAACEAELAVNRRAAAALYLGVRPVTRRDDGGLELGGDGEPVDWLVEMRRFDNRFRLDNLAAQGRLDEPLLRALADAVAAFHLAAEVRPQGAGVAEMVRLVEVNHAALPDWLDRDRRDALRRRSLAAAGGVESLLEARRRQGWVRRGHGDLHLANLVLHDGRPTLFDAIEFDQRLVDIDVLYDLAFLLMDLWQRGERTAANRVLSRYLLTLGSDDGLAALPLFLSLRAAIRAHVTATRARDGDDPALPDLARAYFALSADLLQPAPAALVAVGGLSGSGKSAVARLLAPGIGPAPGAVVLRSDEVRKHLLGRPPEAPLGPEAYTPAMHERVYATLRRRAGEIVRAGHAALVDAVNDRADGREALAMLAREAGVPFHGLWLEAPAEVLAARLAARTGDASDADLAVLRRQLAGSPGAGDWPRIDASGPLEATVERARDALACVQSRR